MFLRDFFVSNAKKIFTELKFELFWPKIFPPAKFGQYRPQFLPQNVGFCPNLAWNNEKMESKYFSVPKFLLMDRKFVPTKILFFWSKNF